MNGVLPRFGQSIFGQFATKSVQQFLAKNGIRLLATTAAMAQKAAENATVQLKFRDALNQAIDEEMERDDRVFLIGEEVGYSDGPFKVSKGLLKKYGDKRIIDTPITEIGFTGIAVGAAYDGLRPICDFMNMGFALQSIDHIINSAAKMYYMSAGKIPVPIVFRGPSGMGAGVAAQHSQDFAAWYAQVPGLKVITPANSEDAKGLLKAAIRDDNPVVFLENELLYGKFFPVSPEVTHSGFILPIGKSHVAREGRDITIVSYANGVNYSLAAAAELAETCGVEAEVINLRTLRPLDYDTVEESIRKTRRCITVETGWPVCGIGAEISARVFEVGLMDTLLAPVIRITGADVPTPYNASLEAQCIPNPKTVVNQVKELMGISVDE